MVKWLAALCLVACQTPDSAPRVEKGSDPTTPPHPAGDARTNVEQPEVRVDARVKVEEPVEAPDPGKQIAELGAIPAWQAVIDRTLYLERRGQKGVVYGVLGVDGWLVDDTEGNGALAIHVVGAATAKAKEGDRLAVIGAWALDDDRHWIWKATAVTPLPAGPPPPAKDPPAAPGHVIAQGELPTGVRPISLAKETEAAYFTVIGTPPLVDGDGWLVADELGNPPYALLNMPGERASYGAQDLRTADERWPLKRGQTYWVRIGPVHKHGPDKPATIGARTAPVRVK